MWNAAQAQIPVEVFGGHKKSTLDMMFFKYFKNKERTNSKFLFFNRNRVSIDYKMTSSSNLPSYGFTEAISYNNQKLKGFAPVIVGQLTNKGVYPKAGIQHVYIKNNFLMFSWAVCELKEKPNLDYFLLTRYEPRITDKLSLYTQLELVNAFPTETNMNFTFVQRVRLGLKIHMWQFGAGGDFSRSGNSNYINTTNTGFFLRYEF